MSSTDIATRRGSLWGPWVLAALGVVAALAAIAAVPGDARGAAAQSWPAFVLVAGLLLVGFVAHEDGLFDAGGDVLARVAPNGWTLYAGTVALVFAVTTLLNLDTSVTFLTPVVVYAARRNAVRARLPCSTGACCCPTPARSCCPGRTSRT